MSRYKLRRNNQGTYPAEQRARTLVVVFTHTHVRGASQLVDAQLLMWKIAAL